MKKLLMFLCAVTLVCGMGINKDVYAITITDQIGVSSSDGTGSLTGGWISSNIGDFSWTHNYSSFTGSITSATLGFDTIDMDSWQPSVNAVLKNGTTTIGSVIGGDNGGTGPWRAIGDVGNDDNLFTLDSSLYSVLQTGTFQLDLSGLGDIDNVWGSNRSVLTIDYDTNGNGAVPAPEPATVMLMGIGIAGLAGGAVRRKLKKKAVDNC